MTPEENNLPEENTIDTYGARQALDAARASSRRADTLIAETREQLDRVRQTREENHFADKFRAIIRGAA